MENKEENSDDWQLEEVKADVRYTSPNGGFFSPICKVYSKEESDDTMDIKIVEEGGNEVIINFKKIKKNKKK